MRKILSCSAVVGFCDFRKIVPRGCVCFTTEYYKSLTDQSQWLLMCWLRKPAWCWSRQALIFTLRWEMNPGKEVASNCLRVWHPIHKRSTSGANDMPVISIATHEQRAIDRRIQQYWGKVYWKGSFIVMFFPSIILSSASTVSLPWSHDSTPCDSEDSTWLDNIMTCHLFIDLSTAFQFLRETHSFISYTVTLVMQLIAWRRRES